MDDIDEVLEEEGLNKDFKAQGYEPLTQQEIEGLLAGNVLKLWQKKVNT